MSDEQKANMQQKALEARQRKEESAKSHAQAVGAEISQKNPGISEDKLEKKIKFALEGEKLEGEKLDSDISTAYKRLEDLHNRRYKRNNPASTGVSIEKIKKLIDA